MKGRPHLSSIVLYSDLTDKYLPLSGNMVTSNQFPLVIGAKQIHPEISDSFEMTDLMYFYFQLQNRTNEYRGHDLYISITKGEEVMQSPMQVLFAGDVDNNNARCLGSFETKNLLPGEYDLWLTLVDKKNATFSTGNRRFTLINKPSK